MHTQGWQPQQPPASHHRGHRSAVVPGLQSEWQTANTQLFLVVPRNGRADGSMGFGFSPLQSKFARSTRRFRMWGEACMGPHKFPLEGCRRLDVPGSFPKGTSGSWPCLTPPSKAPDSLWKEKQTNKKQMKETLKEINFQGRNGNCLSP